MSQILQFVLYITNVLFFFTLFHLFTTRSLRLSTFIRGRHSGVIRTTDLAHVFTNALLAATQRWECTNSCYPSAWTHTLTQSVIHTLTQASFLCPIHLYGMSLDCGGNRSTRRKPTQTRGEHANSTQKGILAQPGLEPVSLAVRQQCYPHYKIIIIKYFS